ncbi:hypothetical protein RJ639_043705 [Escallonia herrerae]|uniref:TF-B3 domain-containing protein n=1 Tax=Escallonia herrerae TaxID=1293975 RepID=A0AA88WD17_9ASTE|nr:hypothetical protein RJ639_043705 [Escallonia herrerae]
MDRTEEVLASLAPEFPSFVKCMLPSNVSYSFWLILPTEFCDLHLPRQNAAVTLVGECGREYKTNYLLERHGLSAGWRGFSIAHRLVKGDMLVFHLVGPCKLKVHIVRVYGLDEVDAALSLMNLNALRKRRRSGKNFPLFASPGSLLICTCSSLFLICSWNVELENEDDREKDDRRRKKAKKHVVDTPPMDTHQSREYIEDCQRDSNSNLGLTAVQFDNSSDTFCSKHPEDVEMTNQLQSDELSCYRSSSSHYHLHEGIGCR